MRCSFFAHKFRFTIWQKKKISFFFVTFQYTYRTSDKVILSCSFSLLFSLSTTMFRWAIITCLFLYANRKRATTTKNIGIMLIRMILVLWPNDKHIMISWHTITIEIEWVFCTRIQPIWSTCSPHIICIVFRCRLLIFTFFKFPQFNRCIFFSFMLLLVHCTYCYLRNVNALSALIGIG